MSVHIRRTDYISNIPASNHIGAISIDYYREAYSYISSKIESPHFFIFSDDIAWAKQNLDFIKEEVIFADTDKSTPDYEDMQLMSLCKHNIIANSSFSWWGAWLNGNEDKIVIAPEKWFADGSTTKDLIPESWISI